jgi:hypothetical protein
MGALVTATGTSQPVYDYNDLPVTTLSLCKFSGRVTLAVHSWKLIKPLLRY